MHGAFPWVCSRASPVSATTTTSAAASLQSTSATAMRARSASSASSSARPGILFYLILFYFGLLAVFLTSKHNTSCITHLSHAQLTGNDVPADADPFKSVLSADRKPPFVPLRIADDVSDAAHNSEILQALKADKRFHVLGPFPDERKELLFEYINELHVQNHVVLFAYFTSTPLNLLFL
jgi:hypothetical protein